MDFCASGYEFEFCRTAKFSVLRIVHGSHCPISSTSSNNSSSKSSSNSNSDSNSDLLNTCSARTELVHFANVNSTITNKSSANELDMVTMQEINIGGKSFSGLDIYNLSSVINMEGKSLSALDIYNLSITKILSAHGCCILGKFFRLSSLETVKLAFKPLVKKLKIRYNEVSDEFDGTSIFQLTYLLQIWSLFTFAFSEMYGA
jgi:hypothetical protein